MPDNNPPVAPRPKVRTIRSYDLTDDQARTLRRLLARSIRKSEAGLAKLRDKLGDAYLAPGPEARVRAETDLYLYLGGRLENLVTHGDT